MIEAMNPMKKDIKNPVLLAVVIAGLNLIAAGRLAAQTFTTLHSLTAGSPNSSGVTTNSDGIYPRAGLILSDNTLYGTAENGGGAAQGTVFALNTDGTGFRTLHHFIRVDEGRIPTAGMTIAGNTLYGTTWMGGIPGNGTVFAVNIDGTGFTNLHSFTALSGLSGTNSDGGNPFAGLVLSGGTLYGTAQVGGSLGWGTVFALSTDGTGFTNLHSFTGGSDGAYPSAGLILSGNTLYGTAVYGGNSNAGTVFALSTDGTGFTNLHTFDFSSEGTEPYAGLVLSGDTLYGTAKRGGALGYGTVFAVNTNGLGFRILHTMNSVTDGAYPFAGLVSSGNTLYGTASYAGSFGSGTIFALNTNGTDFTTLYSFTSGSGLPPGITNSDGAYPYGALVLANNTFYGTAGSGGNSANGTVFSFSLAPQLSIATAGANVILTWATNLAGFDYTGYTLQSTTNLAPPAIWSTNLPAPVVLNGQLTVSNPISGPQQFYRLVH
jgi:uncharacterized repeat protein (TIGR03803 family)